MRIYEIKDWLLLSNVRPELAVAQFGELQRQVPLLYALLSVNSIAVAYTHIAVAPLLLTVLIPAGLVAASIVRMAVWLKKPQAPSSAEDAVKNLRRTALLGMVLAVAYIGWSLSLSEYGGDREQAHIAIFIAITVIGCIFCLMPLPQAALAVTVIVMVPALIHFVSSGDAVYAAIGLNIVLVTIVMMRVLLNSHRGFVQAVTSKTEAERLNQDITVLAHTDVLTGLPNRRRFFQEEEKAVERSRIAKRHLSVGVIDLDRFKSVNDSFGHVIGDRLLKAVGDRLALLCPTDGIVARLGGDEFAFQVYMDGTEAVAFAGQLCEALSEPYVIGELAVSVGASCGLASLADMKSEASLYDAADYALYITKSDRRGMVTAYSSQHAERINTERAMEAALQSAVLNDEMEVHFQPIMDRSGEEVVALEALARWKSPAVGEVSPSIFIPLAERVGIVHRLTLHLLRVALEGMRHAPGSMKLSFNLSAHDLSSAETILGLIAIVNRSGLNPSRVIFELTETAVMRDFDVAEKSIHVLRTLGAEIALDDFGTGQSSLSYLRKLPIDKIKIDRSFVKDAASPGGRDLLSAIIALSRKMKIDCIAEGVETLDQLECLKNLGCDGFQGFLFSKPLPARQVVSWLVSRQHHSFVLNR